MNKKVAPEKMEHDVGGSDGTEAGLAVPSSGSSKKGYNKAQSVETKEMEIDDGDVTSDVKGFLSDDVQAIEFERPSAAAGLVPVLNRRWQTLDNSKRRSFAIVCAITCVLFVAITATIGSLAAALRDARLASNPECLTPSGVVLDSMCRSAGYLPGRSNTSGPVIGDVDFYTIDAAWANATAQMQKLLVYAQLLIPQPVNSSLCATDTDDCQPWTLFRVTILGSANERLFETGSGQDISQASLWFVPDHRGTAHHKASSSVSLALRPIDHSIDRLKSAHRLQQFWTQSAELVLVGPHFADWNMANPQRFVYNRLAIGPYNSRAYQTLSTIGAFRILDIGAPDDPDYLGNNRVISTWSFRFPGSTSGTGDPHSLYSDIEAFAIAGTAYVAVAVERLQPLRWTQPIPLHHNLGVYILDASNELNLQVVSHMYENALWLDAHSITVYQPAIASSLVFGRTMLAVVVRTESVDQFSMPIADCRFYDISVVSRPISLGSWSYAQAWQYINDPFGVGYQAMSADTANYRMVAESIAISGDIVAVASWNFGVTVLRITQYSTWTSLPTQFQLQQIAFYDDQFITKPWTDPLSQPVFSVAVSAALGSVYIADSWPACSGGVIKQLALPTHTPIPGVVPLMQLQASITGSGDTVSSLDIYTPGAPADWHQWTAAQLQSTVLVAGRRRGGFQVLNATNIVANGQAATIAAGSDHSGSEFEYIGVMNAVAFPDAEDPTTTSFVAYSDRALGFGIASVRRWT